MKETIAYPNIHPDSLKTRTYEEAVQAERFRRLDMAELEWTHDDPVSLGLIGFDYENTRTPHHHKQVSYWCTVCVGWYGVSHTSNGGLQRTWVDRTVDDPEITEYSENFEFGFALILCAFASIMLVSVLNLKRNYNVPYELVPLGGTPVSNEMVSLYGGMKKQQQDRNMPQMDAIAHYYGELIWVTEQYEKPAKQNPSRS